MKKYAIISMLAMAIVMLLVGTAFAFPAPPYVHAYAQGTPDKDATWNDAANSCTDCHPSDVSKHTSGPHGGYNTGTNKCALCHTVHVAGNTSLLPGATVTSACNFCHDLTGTEDAPYNQSTGMTVYAAHRVAGLTFNNSWSFRDMGTKVSSTHDNLGATGLDVVTATNVPGADGTTGGDGSIINNAANASNVSGKLSGNVFTCNSCHTPHALPGTTVNKYLGESQVKKTTNGVLGGAYKLYMTDRILRKNLNGAAAVSDYGSAWCAACHKGRDNHAMPGVYNHPVDNTLPGYDFLNQYSGAFTNGAASTADATHTDPVTGAQYVVVDTGNNNPGVGSLAQDPRSNKMYALVTPNPVTGLAFPDGNLNFATYAAAGPSCQQCHASARNVAANFAANTNPLRESFPHVSSNKALLVETGDDFCTNCHGTANLP